MTRFNPAQDPVALYETRTVYGEPDPAPAVREPDTRDTAYYAIREYLDLNDEVTDAELLDLLEAHEVDLPEEHEDYVNGLYEWALEAEL